MESKMTKVRLYTTHCPLCRGLEMALNKANVGYEAVTDVAEMTAKGIGHVPVLEVGGEMLQGRAAYDWVNANRRD